MSIFKKRTMAPNQLATLRELESKVSVGKVRRRRAARCLLRAACCAPLHAALMHMRSLLLLPSSPDQYPPIKHPQTTQVLWHADGLAIISGLNSDAPLGTKLAFVSGASG